MADEAPIRSVSFKFLSWNLSMLVSSEQAPSGWDAEYTEDAIRRFILREQPHWVLFQEIPDHVPYTEGYSLVRQQTESHCGSIVTLMRDDMADIPITHTIVDRCAVLSHLPGLDTTIANVHLTPGKSGAASRLRMLERIRDAASDRILVVGDTNTRVDEEKEISGLGFACDRPPSVTWDTRVNRYRSEMRKYSAYYTRYFIKGDLQVRGVGVANTPLNVDGKKFFLSDHFALSGTLDIPVEST